MQEHLIGDTMVLDTYGYGDSIVDLTDYIASITADVDIKRLIVFCPREHTPVATGDMSGKTSMQHIHKQIVIARDNADKHGITLELVIGRHKYPEIPNIGFEGGIPVRWNDIFQRLFHIIHYLTDWWFKESTSMYCGTHHGQYPFPVPYGKLDHICAARSARPHPHRSATMDAMAKYNLLNDTCSWRQLTTDYYEYDFKYWQEELMLCEEIPLKPDLPESEYSIYTTMHQGAMNSLVELVPESTTEYSFFTEKTTKWLLYGKAFVIVGAPGMHAHLEKLGFELYTELLDYSFDDIPNTEERLDEICKQLRELEDQHPTPEDKQVLLEKIQPKLRRNFDNLVKIINRDYSFTLHEALEAIDFYESERYARDYLSNF